MVIPKGCNLGYDVVEWQHPQLLSHLFGITDTIHHLADTQEPKAKLNQYKHMLVPLSMAELKAIKDEKWDVRKAVKLRYQAYTNTREPARKEREAELARIWEEVTGTSWEGAKVSGSKYKDDEEDKAEETEDQEEKEGEDEKAEEEEETMK